MLLTCSPGEISAPHSLCACMCMRACTCACVRVCACVHAVVSPSLPLTLVLLREYILRMPLHHRWEEKVYGNDKHGHILLCFRYSGIDSSAIAEYDDEELEQLVRA